MSNNMIKDKTAVIFDMDGVIFDTERLYIEACVEVGDKYGADNIEETCHKCIGINSVATAEILYDTYGRDFPLQEFRSEVDEIFVRKFEEKAPVKPGVKELLTYLKSTGYKIAIASSTKKSGVARELEQAGFLEYFDELVCGDMVEKSKPNPDIFLKAAECLGEEPENCIVIEDSFNGIRAAHAAEMFAIMVPDILPPDEEMKEKASLILDSLNDVLSYLKEI